MRVILEEECLRDGLQAVERLFSLSEKMELVRLLAEAGVRRLQVGSFVNPRSVPQVANTDVLVSLVRQQYPDVLCTALVLNEKGLERAARSGLNHLSMSVSVSDSHSRKNSGCPAAEALELMTSLVRLAVGEGISVRAGLMCAFGCVDEGLVDEKVVLDAAARLAEAGAAEINLADTTGMAGPVQVRNLVRRMNSALPKVALSLHCHDTCGLGLVNLYAAYEAGVRIFDVAAGGLGGCPCVEGAAGNVATEEAVHLFRGMGVDTGIDLVQYCKVVSYFEQLLNRPLPGRGCRNLPQV
ncbi:MAG: hydroxymethylglutaryl-CoA lyase [Desulfobulbus sp.]